MGKANFARNQRLYHRGRTSNLDILDVQAVFFVDAAVDRNLNMIRGTIMLATRILVIGWAETCAVPAATKTAQSAMSQNHRSMISNLTEDFI